MHYGNISYVLFLIVIIAVILLTIGDGFNLLPNKSEKGFLLPFTLMTIVITFVPTSLIFGFVGIIFDKKKLLSIFTAALSGIATYFIYHDFVIRTWLHK
jgi:hypothetical protein